MKLCVMNRFALLPTCLLLGTVTLAASFRIGVRYGEQKHDVGYSLSKDTGLKYSENTDILDIRREGLQVLQLKMLSKTLLDRCDESVDHTITVNRETAARLYQLALLAREEDTKRLKRESNIER